MNNLRTPQNQISGIGSLYQLKDKNISKELPGITNNRSGSNPRNLDEAQNEMNSSYQYKKRNGSGNRSMPPLNSSFNGPNYA
jgi:hypothetical protein